MSDQNPDFRNFLTGGLGYTAGLGAGLVLILLVAWLRIPGWLIDFVPEGQPFIRLLASTLVIGLFLALAGGLMGAIGGIFLSRIMDQVHRARLAWGSGIAFGLSTSLLILVFILLIAFIGLYNNFHDNRIEQFSLLFGIFGLIYGLFTGIIQGLLTLRLRYSWRVMLVTPLGFLLGGLLLGLLVRWLNPTDGYDVAPILTTVVLLIGLAIPFFVGGGLLGITYGRLTRRAVEKKEEPDHLFAPNWQTIVLAVLAVLIIVPILGFLSDATNFLTVTNAKLKSQIPIETIGVQWSAPQAYIAEVGPYQPVASDTETVSVTGPDQTTHQAWCGPDGTIQYQQDNGTVEQIGAPGCSANPALALGQDAQPHIVWYAHELEDTNGVIRPTSVLVESIHTPTGWSAPAIAAKTTGLVVPSLVSDEQGNLLLAWEEPDQSRYYSLQEVYQCDESQLTALEQVGLQTILEGGFRPEGTELPYCRNQYRRILYTPNPEPSYSELPATQNGAFDQVSNIANDTHYELLFTTMQYEPDIAYPNPGSVLAQEVAKLYQQLKANPAAYPRGLTVRILLGNYPVMADFAWGTQTIDALSDLHDAGIDKMVDPEIGWRLEVANFAGTYPHSHSKFVVVDGRSVTAAGFNYGYLHFSKDHPSGKGYDLFDLALSIAGPVAQDAISTYDDLWDGANQVYCEDLGSENWRDTCQLQTATVDHIPEVMRNYLPPDGNSNSFSLYRTEVYKEADEFIASTLAAATESIDMIETNFSLELICMANLIFPGICTIDNALPYMDSLLEAIETNQVPLRVIMENTNSNGLENRVAGQVLLDEAQKRGLEDLVQLRFYNGKVHAKSILIDEQLLIIGSQNMHYSSWGKTGLTEYSLSTDDPQAIAEYQDMFAVKWEAAVPFDEAEYSNSP